MKQLKVQYNNFVSIIVYFVLIFVSFIFYIIYKPYFPFYFEQKLMEIYCNVFIVLVFCQFAATLKLQNVMA